MRFNRQRLLQCLMEGPLESPPWQSLVREMRQALDASLVDLLFQRPRGSHVDFIEINDFESRPSDMTEQYRLRYMATEPPLPYFSMQAGKAYTLTDLIGDCDQSEFYRDFLRPAGIDHLIMFYVEEASGFRCWVSVARREDLGPFTDRETANCEWLVEHLQSALKIYGALKRVELERDIYASALRNLHMGYVLLDQCGHVIRMDEEAERLLGGNPDIFLSGNTLRVRHSDKNEELQQIIAEGLASADDFSRGLNIPGSRNLGLLVKSAPDSPVLASPVTPHLVIYISGPTAPAAAPKARIAELFELSPTEAALVAELVHGRTLAEAAANINITEQTARSYSKRIFSKTGTRRQAELVRLILTSVALVA